MRCVLFVCLAQMLIPEAVEFMKLDLKKARIVPPFFQFSRHGAEPSPSAAVTRPSLTLEKLSKGNLQRDRREQGHSWRH
ncbi:hypothetical protein BC567DRAFT_225087 [Phyllosticta citribraziliensis]